MMNASAPFEFDALARCKLATLQGFEAAWIGIEPTFSSKKAVRKWQAFSAQEGGEDAYFLDEWMLGKLRRVGRAMRKKYKRMRKADDPAALFAQVELEHDVDPWDAERISLKFIADEMDGGPFEVGFGLDPETFEFSIKPIPLVWLRDDRFVRFLQLVVWDVPMEHGLVPSIAHGGGQFSFSAKTWLQGTLLADDIATKLDHPELSTWITDYPNCDDRSFRATRRRFEAFRAILDQYWSGAFHPKANGALLVENALLDTGFGPACAPQPGWMDPKTGPLGSPRDVFQTNFAFGRAVRLYAQNVHPGYWQSQHPGEDGYRPDQIMRYSEGNLNRLQIAGELHVKSGRVLDKRDVAELDAPLELSMLYDDASWEQRGQMSRTSAEDFVEAALLDAHHAQWLLTHGNVTVRASLAQDKLSIDAEKTLEAKKPKLLARLRKEARAASFEAARGRIKSDFIEPETLFWAAWKALERREKAEIAREAISGFVERVENAATMDARKKHGDPMEPHRHRVHPLLWRALDGDAEALEKDATLTRELELWRAHETRYRERRPIWSPTDAKPPWAV